MAKQFNPDEFLTGLKESGNLESNYDSVMGLLKVQLALLAKKLNVKHETSMRKPELQGLVLSALNTFGLISDDVFEEEIDESVHILRAKVELVQAEKEAKVELVRAEKEAEKEKSEARLREIQAEKQAEKEKVQIEKEKLQVEKEKLQVEKERSETRIRELQAQAEVDTKISHAQAWRVDFGNKAQVFDVTKNVRLVPQFQDKDLDAYFATFDHTATTLDWPLDKWTILLSTALKGKAQIAYSSLSPEDKGQYKAVKQAILLAYELVPEAYRQKFREFKKQDSQTHTEYVKEKERMFDKWCRSREVVKFEGLKNLVLLEDFKENISRNTRSHLDDLDVKDVHEAAKRADDYTVTHKLGQTSGQSRNKSQNEQKTSWFSGPRGAPNQNDQKGGSFGSKFQKRDAGKPSNAERKWCDFHRVPSHSNEECFHQKKDQRNPTAKTGEPVSLVSQNASKNRDKGKAPNDTQRTNPVSLTVGQNQHKRAHTFHDSQIIQTRLIENRSDSQTESQTDQLQTKDDLHNDAQMSESDTASVESPCSPVDGRFSAFVSREPCPYLLIV